MKRLDAAFVGRAKNGLVEPGRYQDGGGLMLNVSTGGASWLLRYQLNGKRKDMGLGPLERVGLAKARELAVTHLRTIKGDKVDPLHTREAEREERAKALSFKIAAERYIAAHEPSWKNAKHRQQWRNTLATYAYPTLQHVAVGKVTPQHVVSILQPIWTKKPETANRVRSRIELVLDWAKAQGMRSGDNPARWRGHLDAVFPAKTKVRAVKHHEAVPVDALASVYAALRESKGIAAAAARFCILTAARPGEVAEADVAEIDRDASCWTVPAQRQKSNKPHRVPLTAEAIAILDAMDAIRAEDDRRLFPGGTEDKPLSLTALTKALRTAGAGDATMHGTARSSFDDWASERTSYPSRLIDRVLAHGPKSKTVQAYRRSELYDQRKPLMADWAAFLRGE